MKRDQKIKRLEEDLRKARRAQTLLNNEDFIDWYLDELLEDAKRYCVMVAEENRPNYDRAMSSGIIRFVKRKFAELKRVGDAERLKKLQTALIKLEESNAEGRKDPDPGAGRLPFGIF